MEKMTVMDALNKIPTMFGKLAIDFEWSIATDISCGPRYEFYNAKPTTLLSEAEDLKYIESFGLHRIYESTAEFEALTDVLSQEVTSVFFYLDGPTPEISLYFIREEEENV